MPARGDDFQIVLQIQFVFDIFFDVADDLSGRYDFGKNIFKPERLKDFFAELIFPERSTAKYSQWKTRRFFCPSENK